MSLQSPSHLNDLDHCLVFDASVVINILGTGDAVRLIRSLNRRCVVEHVAWREVRRDPVTGDSARRALDSLVSAGLLQREVMQSSAMDRFLGLVLAQSPDGLDDGEAATLAHAAATEATAVIDERKAIRIGCGAFPGLRILSTLDLLSSPTVIHAIGKVDLADAVFSALVHARMRVPTAFREWILELLGTERASKCPSLGQVP
jgi:predicted nucleic acid-binding protein